MRRVLYLALLATTLLPAIAASAETPAEKQMAGRIGNQFKKSGQLHNYTIGVSFHDGVASLEGTVTSAEQRNAAIHLAQQVKGVSRVECKLAIAGMRSSSDSHPSNGDDRYELSAALDRASRAVDDGDSSGVVHAYQQTSEYEAKPSQRSPMMMGNNGRNAMRSQRNNMPLPCRPNPGMMPIRQASVQGVYQAGGPCAGGNGGPTMGAAGGGPGMGPMPSGFVPQGSGRGPSYDNASMPGYAWPSYASYPNYAALTYPQQYSPTAWPYIGPFYPYPQVPLAWRKVSLEWDDGWWFLDFSSHNSSH